MVNIFMSGLLHKQSSIAADISMAISTIKKLLRIYFGVTLVLCSVASIQSIDMLVNRSETASQESVKATNLFATVCFTLTFAYGILSAVSSPSIRRIFFKSLSVFVNE